MSISARTRSLQVRPIHSADLSFNVSGVIDERNMPIAKLGAHVPATDYRALVLSRLTSENFGSDGLFAFGPDAARAALSPSSLYALRNDATAASATQAILQRKVAFLQKYKHVESIIQAFLHLYPVDQSDPNGKIEKLKKLAVLQNEKEQRLQDKYATVDGGKYGGVLTETLTDLRSKGTATLTTSITPLAMSTPEHTVEVRAVAGAPAAGNADHLIKEAKTIPQRYLGGAWQALVPDTDDFGFKSQRTVQDPSALRQKSITKGQEFRFPSKDSEIRQIRTQLDLMDELLREKTTSMRIPELKGLFESELALLDQEIFKTMIRYTQTFLFSPVAGRVTAVYKDVGESVQAGEPVIRVENDEDILLVGAIQARFPVVVGQTAEIVARNVFESSDTVTLAGGRVVSVRGHDANDDVWDVIVECRNEAQLASGHAVRLPINYQFDKTETEIRLGY